MLIIHLPEKKLSKLAKSAQKMINHGEKVMQCVEELCEAAEMDDESGYGNRDGGGYGNRGGGYGNRMGGGYGNRGNYGNRDDDDDEDDEDFGERRGVKGTGRYGRRYR